MHTIFMAIVLVGLSVLAEERWMKTLLAAGFLALGAVTLIFGIR